MKKLFLILTVGFFTFYPNKGFCASAEDIDRLTTYAILTGRGLGCGYDMQNELSRGGSWMDRTFENNEKSALILVFTTGMEQAANEQANGSSPDNCATIRKVIAKTVWP